MKVAVTFTLTLSYKEVHWLKTLLQNSMSSYESNEDADMRKTLWDALPSFEKLNELGNNCK